MSDPELPITSDEVCENSKGQNFAVGFHAYPGDGSNVHSLGRLVVPAADGLPDASETVNLLDNQLCELYPGRGYMVAAAAVLRRCTAEHESVAPQVEAVSRIVVRTPGSYKMKVRPFGSCVGKVPDRGGNPYTGCLYLIYDNDQPYIFNAQNVFLPDTHNNSPNYNERTVKEARLIYRGGGTDHVYVALRGDEAFVNRDCQEDTRPKYSPYSQRIRDKDGNIRLVGILESELEAVQQAEGMAPTPKSLAAIVSYSNPKTKPVNL
ncbi:hypothetical protein BH23PAT1_BH23PAT1_2420 [soil metagenome]